MCWMFLGPFICKSVFAYLDKIQFVLWTSWVLDSTGKQVSKCQLNKLLYRLLWERGARVWRKVLFRKTTIHSHKKQDMSCPPPIYVFLVGLFGGCWVHFNKVSSNFPAGRYVLHIMCIWGLRGHYISTNASLKVKTSSHPLPTELWNFVKNTNKNTITTSFLKVETSSHPLPFDLHGTLLKIQIQIQQIQIQVQNTNIKCILESQNRQSSDAYWIVELVKH